MWSYNYTEKQSKLEEQIELSEVRKISENTTLVLLQIITAPSYRRLDSQIPSAVILDRIRRAPASAFGILPALFL